MPLLNKLYIQEDTLQLLQKKVSTGDEWAFGKIYTIYSNRLINFSSSMVHVHTIAEEVVEDVFISLWINRSKILAIENLPVYLYTAVKNRSLNKLSELSKRLITTSFDSIHAQIQALEENPADKLISSEMLQKANEAINQLPPKCKMIFKLIREDGLKYKEVAEILNISVNTIDAQMAIAVKKITTTLGLNKANIKNKITISTKKV